MTWHQAAVRTRAKEAAAGGSEAASGQAAAAPAPSAGGGGGAPDKSPVEGGPEKTEAAGQAGEGEGEECRMWVILFACCLCGVEEKARARAIGLLAVVFFFWLCTCVRGGTTFVLCAFVVLSSLEPGACLLRY